MYSRIENRTVSMAVWLSTAYVHHFYLPSEDTILYYSSNVTRFYFSVGVARTMVQ